MTILLCLILVKIRDLLSFRVRFNHEQSEKWGSVLVKGIKIDDQQQPGKHLQIFSGLL